MKFKMMHGGNTELAELHCDFSYTFCVSSPPTASSSAAAIFKRATSRRSSHSLLCSNSYKHDATSSSTFVGTSCEAFTIFFLTSEDTVVVGAPLILVPALSPRSHGSSSNEAYLRRVCLWVGTRTMSQSIYTACMQTCGCSARKRTRASDIDDQVARTCSNVLWPNLVVQTSVCVLHWTFRSILACELRYTLTQERSRCAGPRSEVSWFVVAKLPSFCTEHIYCNLSWIVRRCACARAFSTGFAVHIIAFTCLLCARASRPTLNAIESRNVLRRVSQ